MEPRVSTSGELCFRECVYFFNDTATTEIYTEAGDEVSAENLEKMDAAGIDKLVLLDIAHNNTGPWNRNTPKADKAEDRDQALSDIYRLMRPGEPPTRDTAEPLFGGLLFSRERCQLHAVRRAKHNMLPGPYAGST